MAGDGGRRGRVTGFGSVDRKESTASGHVIRRHIGVRVG